jgi:hypothetical protein
MERDYSDDLKIDLEKKKKNRTMKKKKDYYFQ